MKTISLLIISIIIGISWWKLWIYSGWYKPPNFLKYFLSSVDGEASYDVVMLEMIVLILIIFFIIRVFLKLAKGIRNNR